jgi:hypothetical protein
MTMTKDQLVVGEGEQESQPWVVGKIGHASMLLAAR